MKSRTRKYPPPEERLWARVRKTETCWLWLGAPANTWGYGWISVNRKQVLVHRYSYMLHQGPIPEGRYILHSCDNTQCVNPAHLRAGTLKENTQDCLARRRHNWQTLPQSHCRHGHEYTPANTRMVGKWRRCRACDRDAESRRKAKRMRSAQ